MIQLLKKVVSCAFHSPKSSSSRSHVCCLRPLSARRKMAAVKKSLIKTSRSSAWRQAKKKSSCVTECRPATASIFAKLFQWATPTPATKSPATALIAWPKCVTSSAGAKSFLRVCKLRPLIASTCQTASNLSRSGKKRQSRKKSDLGRMKLCREGRSHAPVGLRRLSSGFGNHFSTLIRFAADRAL